MDPRLQEKENRSASYFAMIYSAKDAVLNENLVLYNVSFLLENV